MQDLFGGKSLRELILQGSEREGRVRIADIPVPTYTMPEGLREQSISFTSAYRSEAEAFIAHLEKRLERANYPLSTSAAVYEALINAFQHGNREDPAKPVLYGESITHRRAKFVVADCGETISARFTPFILNLRDTESAENVPNWYEFSGLPVSNPANRGIGTKLMHSAVDFVHYYRAPSGGLLVELTKKAYT